MDNMILGIDLGTNSIGWALRNTDILIGNQIVDYGVVTFEKGVASEKGNEFPKVQKRTESRGKRRNYQAEKYRKHALLEFLIERNMCPLDIEELNQWRKYTKGQKRRYPQSEKFIQWLRYDFNGDGKPDFHLLEKDKTESCFVFRALVVEDEYKDVYQNNPYILGRVLYQLVQRRGFRGRDEEEAKTMLQGSEKTGTAGRNDIAEYIEKYKTLGAALYYYQADNGGRIRKRYNLRRDYEDELKVICKVQSISESDYQKLWKTIVWQRPLRTQKGLIGTCIYEKNKKRASISHPLYEEYRTWVFINNLKITPPKGIDKSIYLKEKIYPIFYKSSNDFEFNTILKQLKKDGASLESKFKEKTKVVSAKLLKIFQDILGHDWKERYGWEEMHNRESKPPKKSGRNYSYEDIWHVLNTFDGHENLKKFAIEKLNLGEVEAEKFSKIKLNKGYATLSLSAIKKIIPFLQKGFLYSQAVYLANLYKVLGEEKITDELINRLAKDIEVVIQDNKFRKEVINIVNGLISDELNSEYRYSLDVNKDLDESEKNQVKEKIISAYGEKSWEDFDTDKQNQITDYVSSSFKDFLKKSVLSKRNVFLEQPRLHDQIFGLIQDKYKVSAETKKHLWHPSEQETYAAASEYRQFSIDGKSLFVSEKKIELFLAGNANAEFQGRSLKLLGNPEPLSKGFKNPMALKTLHKLKQLINYFIQTGKIDEDSRVIVEIARELNDANKRKAIERWNNEREKENESFKNIIREINKESKTNYDENDKTLLRKIRLWQEQNKMCLYTGKMIAACDVFNGALYDLEHTIPVSISFDSELKNLTLADSNFNRNVKGKLFPTQLQNYDEIKPRLQFIEDKVDHLEDLFKEWKNKASYASTKDMKDSCIQRYHMIKMDLDYWKAKLHTFTLEEYKAGWKNSQLRDTQIVTKYALPYLKTVFNKVAVEKSQIVNVFKEIYQVKLPFDKKNRNTHAHHAIDAAILTLIPPFYDRDKILLKYFEEMDRRTGNIYHEQPQGWKDFSASKILFIEKDILINNLSENKTTLHTYKHIRKRGKIDYVRFKDANGGWKFKLDKVGNKIPKIAEGDTIRGQLHGESFYGAIKQPIRNDNNKIVFDNEGKMKLHDDLYVVIRKPLLFKKDANSPGFKSLEEIEKVIVDKDLFLMIKKQVELTDFKTALSNGIYMLGKNGEPVNKIRRIRCKENLKYTSGIKVHTHNFISKKEYKQNTLAINGENSLCLFYKNEYGRAINIQSIMNVAAIGAKSDKHYFEESNYNQMVIGKGKSKKILPLYAVLRSGQKVLFYRDVIEELQSLSKDELSRRLYKMYQFESDGRIKFKHHLAAGIDTELKKYNIEYSVFNTNDNAVFLRLSQGQWNFAIENVNFEMCLDGSIIWLK